MIKVPKTGLKIMLHITIHVESSKA